MKKSLPVISIWIDKDRDRGLLYDYLSMDYNVFDLNKDKELFYKSNLVIIDGKTLSENEELLKNFKDNSEYFIPVLLLTTNEYVTFLTNFLWKTVDEIIFMPVQKIELKARVEILLRTHNYYFKLWEELKEKNKIKDNILSVLSKDFNIDYLYIIILKIMFGYQIR